jgi:hypothetical protein
LSVVIRRLTAQTTFVANCPAAATLGDMVYISGPKVGDYYQVGLCDIDEYAKRTIGMVVAKESATVCNVQYSGFVSGLYSGMTPGLPLFLSVGAGGRLVQFPPLRSAVNNRYLEIVGKAASSDIVLLEIQEPKILAIEPPPVIPTSTSVYGEGVYGG